MPIIVSPASLLFCSTCYAHENHDNQFANAFNCYNLSRLALCQNYEIEGSGTIDKTRDALGRLSYGVYVVSVRWGDEVNAMTMRMVSQVGVRPPRVALTMRKRSYTYELIRESGHFVINVLAQGQELLGGHFGLRSGRNGNKFTALEHDVAASGAPILHGCSAHLECCLEATHDMGTYVLLIGQVKQAAVHDRLPLTYREDDYYG